MDGEFGGPGRSRTDDIPLAGRMLYQLSYRPIKWRRLTSGNKGRLFDLVVAPRRSAKPASETSPATALARQSRHFPLTGIWSGLRESNPPGQLGRLLHKADMPSPRNRPREPPQSLAFSTESRPLQVKIACLAAYARTVFTGELRTICLRVFPANPAKRQSPRFRLGPPDLRRPRNTTTSRCEPSVYLRGQGFWRPGVDSNHRPLHFQNCSATELPTNIALKVGTDSNRWPVLYLAALPLSYLIMKLVAGTLTSIRRTASVFLRPTPPKEGATCPGKTGRCCVGSGMPTRTASFGL